MAPFIESLANKPSPASLAPISSLFLLGVPAKVRIAGRLLSSDLASGWLLLGSHDRQAGVWVEFIGEESTLAGLVGNEGEGSCWMALGDLEEVQSLPPTPPDLPLGLAQTLQITPDRVLRAIVLRAVDDEPRGAGGFDLRGWEEGAKVRSAGLTG